MSVRRLGEDRTTTVSLDAIVTELRGAALPPDLR